MDTNATMTLNNEAVNEPATTGSLYSPNRREGSFSETELPPNFVLGNSVGPLRCFEELW